MMIKIQHLLFAALLILPQPFLLAQLSIEDSEPHQVIRQISRDVLDALERTRDQYDENPQAFYDAIEAAVGPAVDFERMAYLVMDQQYYSMATEEQRAEFVEVFRESLVETYARGLIGVTETSFEIAPPREEDADKSMVNIQQTLQGGGDRVSVVYAMRKGSDDRWLLNNVIIEGINLGRTFRNQFAQLASRYSGDIDQVIANWSPEQVDG